GEHEVIDGEGVLTRLKQLRHSHVLRRSVSSGPHEDVVVRDNPPRRKLASRRRNAFHHPPQLNFLLQEVVARSAVHRRLARKMDSACRGHTIFSICRTSTLGRLGKLASRHSTKKNTRIAPERLMFGYRPAVAVPQRSPPVRPR